jgi:hypothetical protein
MESQRIQLSNASANCRLVSDIQLAALRQALTYFICQQQVFGLFGFRSLERNTRGLILMWVGNVPVRMNRRSSSTHAHDWVVRARQEAWLKTGYVRPEAAQFLGHITNESAVGSRDLQSAFESASTIDCDQKLQGVKQRERGLLTQRACPISSLLGYATRFMR